MFRFWRNIGAISRRKLEKSSKILRWLLAGLSDNWVITMTTALKAIIYVRVSSDEQVLGTSLESQDEQCRAYCQRRGMEVVKAFREEGESAKDLKFNNRKELLL